MALGRQSQGSAVGAWGQGGLIECLDGRLIAEEPLCCKSCHRQAEKGPEGRARDSDAPHGPRFCDWSWLTGLK